MKILVVCHAFPPEAQGGVQSSTHDLALRLLAAGGAPSVLAPLYGDGFFGMAARARSMAVCAAATTCSSLPKRNSGSLRSRS